VERCGIVGKQLNDYTSKQAFTETLSDPDVFVCM